MTAEQVTLTVYNMLGQAVAILVNESLSPGTYKATFDGSRLTSGIYYYTLEAGSFKTVKKLVLTK